MSLEFNGLLGVLIFLVTVAALGIATLVALAVFIFAARTPQRERKTRWSKYFLLSGVIFLCFNGLFYLFLPKTMTSQQGKALDWWMFYVWIPCHLIGYFLSAVALRYILSPKPSTAN